MNPPHKSIPRIVFTLCALVLVLVACNSTKRQLVGTWRTEGLVDSFEIMVNPTFGSDGSLNVDARAMGKRRGKYEFVDADHIRVTIPPHDSTIYEVKVSGELLTMTDQNNHRLQFTRRK